MFDQNLVSYDRELIHKFNETHNLVNGEYCFPYETLIRDNDGFDQYVCVEYLLKQCNIAFDNGYIAMSISIKVSILTLTTLISVLISIIKTFIMTVMITMRL